MKVALTMQQEQLAFEDVYIFQLSKSNVHCATMPHRCVFAISGEKGHETPAKLMWQKWYSTTMQMLLYIY